MLRACADASPNESSQRSALVEIAGTWSWFDTKHSSDESGEKAYCTGPPSWNGGESMSPGVRSRTAPVSALARKMCVRVPSFHAVQCR